MSDSCVTYHRIAHEDDHAFVKELQVIEDLICVWSCICHIDHVCCLDEYKGKLFHQVLMLPKIRNRETWREEHVYEYNFKPSHAENCVVN